MSDQLKKKRKKLKALRKELHCLQVDSRRRCDEEKRELEEYIAKCENTIQDLLTLRMFLRSSIEWIKASVSDSFPQYNSFIYTLMFSNFALFLSNAFVDFITETEDSMAAETMRAFWIPYIIWTLFGIIGWFFDRYVSKKNSIGRKLDIVREATFGGIATNNMYSALDPSSGLTLDTVFDNIGNCELKQKLGSFV